MGSRARESDWELLDSVERSGTRKTHERLLFTTAWRGVWRPADEVLAMFVGDHTLASRMALTLCPVSLDSTL